ncbi:pyrroline-5-carboxylate reductase [Geitlerinema sp. PCC 9228]|uniref:pyrroline-5-carboxylate reductase n=1 Tax=Geitlerinema sp. PCC 9228 TaxID=111611 RepID=UPI0008F9911C
MQLGTIGGGVMAEAIVSRLVNQQVYSPSEMVVSDPSAEKREKLASRYGVRVTENNREAAQQAQQVLLLAVKPQIFDRVVAQLGPPSHKNQLVLSVLAGMPLSRLEAAFPEQPVIRAMPNTPATVGAGMTAIAPGAAVQSQHLEIARRILEAVGQVVTVPEYQMDAVTGVSGSGPGYVSVFIEALTDGGVAAGLPRSVASQLAVQAVLGTAQLLQETGMDACQLKNQVTSPGGTTITGIAQLERAGLRAATIDAVQAACRRSQELGQGE